MATLTDVPNESKEPLKSMPPPYIAQEPQYPNPQMSQIPLNPVPQLAQTPLGPEPCMVICPSCNSSVVSSVQTVPGMQTHLLALLLCFICICCTCIPYMVEGCQNVEHRCPNCNTYLGTYKR